MNINFTCNNGHQRVFYISNNHYPYSTGTIILVHCVTGIRTHTAKYLEVGLVLAKRAAADIVVVLVFAVDFFVLENT